MFSAYENNFLDQLFITARCAADMGSWATHTDTQDWEYFWLVEDTLNLPTKLSMSDLLTCDNKVFSTNSGGLSVYNAYLLWECVFPEDVKIEALSGMKVKAHREWIEQVSREILYVWTTPEWDDEYYLAQKSRELLDTCFGTWDLLVAGG